MSEDDFTAALREHGFLPAASGGSDFNRLTAKGTVIYNGEDIVAAYNPKTKEPALIVQLLRKPREYQSAWIDKDGVLAQFLGRPHMAGKFCKSHFDDPKEARKYAEDGTSCDECPIHPFVPRNDLPEEANGRKCAWKADVEFVILEKNDKDELQVVDPTVWTMSLATTAVIEFVGSSSKKKGDNLAGSVSQFNTMVRIAKLGVQKWGPAGIMKAMTYLELGGVICALRLLPMENKEMGRSWTVPSFEPIEILEVDEQAALPTSEKAPPASDVSTDDIPF
ncbi:MAG: hypothetical protein WB239_05270 [Acidimicrobiia bacterium]